MSIRFVEQQEENKKVIVNIEQNRKHTYEYGDKCVCMNIEEEGNAYTSLDTHTQK